MAWAGTTVQPRRRAAVDEARLTGAGAAGDTGALATLFERYEARAFNIAFRITGSEDDAADATRDAFTDVVEGLRERPAGEVAFGPCLAVAVHNASYAVIGKRRQTAPRDASAGVRAAADVASAVEAEDAGGDQASGALLDDWRERMRQAHACLPVREREVLALHELGDLSYRDIAAVMDMNPDSVAELVALARLELRDALRASELTSADGPSDGCGGALPLMAARDDGELEPSHDADWLIDHLASCRECRAKLDAMQEARLAYADWKPVAAPARLSQEALARASELSAAAQSAAGGAAVATTVSVGADDAVASAVARGGALSARKPGSSRVTGEFRRRRRQELLLAGGWATALLVGALALLVGGVFESAEGDDPEPDPTAPAAAQHAAPPVPEPRPRSAVKPKKKKRPDAAPARAVPQVARPAPVVIVAPRVAPQRRPERAPRRRARRPRRESSRPTPPQSTPPPGEAPQTPQPAPAPGATPTPTTPPPQPPAGCPNPAGQQTPCPPG